MKHMLDNLAFVLGILLGLVLFLFGVRQTLRRKDAKGVLAKIFLAANIALFGLGSLFAQEADVGKETTGAESETKARDKLIAEVARMKEWKELCRTWRSLLKCLNDTKPLTDDLLQKREQIVKDLQLTDRGSWEPLVRENQAADAPLLTAAECLKHVKHLALQLMDHIVRLCGGATCYDRAPFQGQQPPIKEQQELLEQQVKEGKISATVHKRVQETMNAFAERYTVVGQNLTDKNCVLLFKLIEQICGPAKVDISEMSPDLAKKIDEYIEQLGADKLEKREQAGKSLIEIGDMAIPKLREAAKNDKDLEVKTRAEKILAEFD